MARARAAGPKRKTGAENALGPLLRLWRERRRMSQLTLAVEAEISSRHLSFIETGRAKPSREMVLLLARVLDVPPRGRNELLLAAGYAPVYLERGLESPEMTQVRRALDFMLRQQEPFPALVIDGHWNVLMSNEGMQRVMGLFLDPAKAATLGPANAMRLFYHPMGVRPYIVNWEATAAALIQWLHRDLLRGDSEIGRLLDELLSYPDVPHHWRKLDLDASTAPFLAVELARDDIHLKFFSTLTSLGVPYDITLHELRVEGLLPGRRGERGADASSRPRGGSERVYALSLGTGAVRANGHVVHDHARGRIRVHAEGVGQGAPHPARALDGVEDGHVVGIRDALEAIVLTDHQVFWPHGLSAAGGAKPAVEDLEARGESAARELVQGACQRRVGLRIDVWRHGYGLPSF